MKSIKSVFLKTFQVLTLVLFVGCSRIQMNVNGYLSGSEVTRNGNVLTVLNNDAQNTLLDQEIGEKIKRGLALKGLKNVDEISNADYVLTFKYSIDSGKTTSETYSTNTQKTRLNIHSGKLEPYNEVEVQTDTSTKFTRQLILYLWDASSLIKPPQGLQQKSLVGTESIENGKPLWIGEVRSEGRSSDLRKVINYLIVGAIEEFGKNTKSMKRYTLIENDKRAKALD